jgi:hypothetical protein
VETAFWALRSAGGQEGADVASFKFKAGQRVLIVGSKPLSAPRGRYRIIGALPNVEGQARYRVKGEIEQYERVVDEAELEAAEE